MMLLIFFLSLISAILVKICLGVVLFQLILFRIFCVSENWMSGFFSTLVKFSSIISINVLCPFLSSPSGLLNCKC